jgi:hypothetical protein
MRILYIYYPLTWQKDSDFEYLPWISAPLQVAALCELKGIIRNGRAALTCIFSFPLKKLIITGINQNGSL